MQTQTTYYQLCAITALPYNFPGARSVGNALPSQWMYTHRDADDAAEAGYDERNDLCGNWRFGYIWHRRFSSLCGKLANTFGPTPGWAGSPDQSGSAGYDAA